MNNIIIFIYVYILYFFILSFLFFLLFLFYLLYFSLLYFSFGSFLFFSFLFFSFFFSFCSFFFFYNIRLMNNPRWISLYIFFEKLSIRFLEWFLLPHRYIIHLVRIILFKTWRKPIFIICLRYDPEKKMFLQVI